MHGSTCLFLVVIAAFPSQAPDDGEAALRRLLADADDERAKGNDVERARLLEEFIAKSPPKEFRDLRLPALEALADLAHKRRDQSAERRWLLELVSEFPVQAWNGAGGSMFRELILPTLAWVPKRVRAGRPAELRIHRSTETPAKYTVFRIPTAQFLAHEGSEWNKWVRDALTVASKLPVEEWTESAELKADLRGWYSIHFRNASPGVYALREEIEGLTVLHPFAIRGFDVACSEEGERVVVWVIDSWDGTPKEGVPIDVRFPEIDRRIEGCTDAAGLFLYDLPAADSSSWILARLGDEVWALDAPYARGPKETQESLVAVTTDRPIYRPGATVQYKAVRRDQEGGALSLPPRERVRVELRAPYGQLLDHAEHEWNANGSLWGSFRVGDEPPLGVCNLVVRVESQRGDGYFEWIDDRRTIGFRSKPFTVAAYRRPELEFSVDLTGDPVRGGTVRARIHAEYSSGGPVAGAELRWWLEPSHRIFREEREASYRPPLDDPRAWVYERHYETQGKNAVEQIFAEDVGGFDFDSESPWWASNTVAEGRGTTDEDGSLDVEPALPPHAPKTLAFMAAVRDASMLTVWGGVDFLARDPVAVHVTSDRLFFVTGEMMEVQVRVAGAAGRPLPGREVEVVVFEGRRFAEDPLPPEDGPPAEQIVLRAPFTPLDPWTGHEFESILRATATTGERGVASVRVPVDRSCLVRVLARIRDGRDRVYEDRTHLRWAQLEGPADAPKDRDDAASQPRIDLEVIPDRVVYEVGETIRLLVRSNRAPVHALLTAGGKRSHAARVVHLERRETVLEVPVSDEHVPNTVLHVLAHCDGRARRQSHEVFVNPRAHVLDVAVSTDRETYGPGEKAKVTVTTHAGGTPVAAEVELSLVDASVRNFVAQDKEDARSLFLPRRYSPPYLFGATCGDVWEERRSEADRWQYPGGTGTFHSGGFEGNQTIYERESPLLRRNIPETLYWHPHLETAADGRAEVEVEMPDSLSEWRVLARAASGVDRFGSAESRALSRPKVVLKLLAPRFLTAGDEAVVATVLQNHLDREARFRLALAAEKAEVAPADGRVAPVAVSVPRGGAQRVDWRLRSAAVSSLVLRATASEEAQREVTSDAVEVSLPVLDASVERSVTANGVVRAGRWSAVLEAPAGAIAGSASLEVRATASIAEVIRRALGFLAEYPYGCVEQTMSRFLPAVVALRAMDRAGIDQPPLARRLPEMTRQGLQHLYALQDSSGHWGWWQDDGSDARMTAYVLFGLATARQAGVEVDERTWTRGLEALGRLQERDVLPETVLVSTLVGQPMDPAAQPKPYTLIEEAYLVLAGRKDLAEGLVAPAGDDTGPQGVLETALVLKALHSVDPTDARLPGLVERLIGMRRGDAWHSTFDTAWAVYALSDLLGSRKERPAPAWKLRLGGQELVPQAGSVVVMEPELLSGPLRIEVEAEGGEVEAVFASAVLRLRSGGEALRRGGGDLIRVRRVFERFEPNERGGSWLRVRRGEEVGNGEALRVVVTVHSERELRHVLLESPLPAGAEALRYSRQAGDDEHFTQNFARLEFRDDRVVAALEEVHEGQAEKLVFSLRPTHPGVYYALPAHAFAMYNPDRSAWSDGFVLRVGER